VVAAEPTPAPTGSGREAARSLHVTLVVANTFQFDSRQLRTASTLAADGHSVRILAWSGPDLPAEEQLTGGLRLTRIPLDRRISSALRPLPMALRRLVCRVLALDAEAVLLPPDAPRGLDRLRHPVRRLLEVMANARRVGPWADAVVDAAPETDVFHAKALITLPVVREAARRVSGCHAGGQFMRMTGGATPQRCSTRSAMGWLTASVPAASRAQPRSRRRTSSRTNPGIRARRAASVW